MYSFTTRVRYSETDWQKKMTPATIVKYFQDCSIFHSEEASVGLEHVTQAHRAWIMCFWQVRIIRTPKVLEDITVSTWPYDFKGMYGYRNFTMKDATGTVVAYANSIWVLMDTEKKHPTRIEASDMVTYPTEPPYPMEYANRKLSIPKTLTSLDPFKVNQSSIDMFQHVNNGEYIRFAQDLLPDDFIFEEIRVEYKKSAHLGDVIHPLIHRQMNEFTVILADQEQAPYAIVTFLHNVE